MDNRFGSRKRKRGGYVQRFCPHHLRADALGYVMEHILIMEEFLRRKLNSLEIVHHINSVANDNRIENLMLFQNDSEHQKHHRRQRALLDCGNETFRKCSICKKWDAPENLYMCFLARHQIIHHKKCKAIYDRKRRENRKKTNGPMLYL